MNLQNLSRPELITHLQGRPRNEVLEAALQLHAAKDTTTVATARVPKGTAVGMASLASAPERMKLRKSSPDLFDRKPQHHEIMAGKALIRDLYGRIDISERGGVEKRRRFRSQYPDAFR